MKPGVVSHTCDSNTWDITKVRSWVQGYLGLRSRIMSQKKKKKSLGIYWYTVSVIKTLDRSDKISCNKACVDINLVLGKELIISYQLRSSSATLKKKSFFFFSSNVCDVCTCICLEMYSCVHAQMPEEGVRYPYSLETGSLNTPEATLAMVLLLPEQSWASF